MPYNIVGIYLFRERHTLKQVSPIMECLNKETHSYTYISICCMYVETHLYTYIVCMLCNVVLWYVMLYVMICYVMCYVICYDMLCYVMLCYVMLCYVMLCYVMLCYVMLCYVVCTCVVGCVVDFGAGGFLPWYAHEYLYIPWNIPPNIHSVDFWPSCPFLHYLVFLFL